MKDGGRLTAAIEVLQEVETRHRPVQAALRDWGTAHRFAGSGDRTVIGNLVFDALRNKASLSAVMQSGDPRGLVFATYVKTWEKGLLALEDALAQDRHAPEPLSEQEKKLLSEDAQLRSSPAEAADVPDWLWSRFEASLGENAVTEGQALARRAPVDLRVNTLKSNRDKVLKRLAHTGAKSSSLSPVGIRIEAKPGLGRMPHVQAEEGYQKGWFELQDEASQLAAQLAKAEPGEQVLDYCAGGGGKTLALAASMQNKGQLYAFDADRLRLAPIHERLKRAGIHNIQVRDPASTDLKDLEAQMDLVFIDAPCTGTGVWRRRPDSKWRLSERALEDRIKDQRHVLENAKKYVKNGGRLVYATCSVLREENQSQSEWFLEQNPEFQALSALDIWKELLPEKALPDHVSESGSVMLTPHSTGTDGFFISVFKKQT
ncbi:RsmB/NOP family class I SAM-dependent RNA methyltransferase [Roseibium porphyridii]|uniref:RsmB/NOP family class I SAM-dependent RNA methyltransferase n=1 Tax=Roseibium porphyridii TaxID=2866279 RepID=A0ABY8EX52_9HYPH|nr:RsmB/NOP family class I SAM-dependent RNA methyltransferase [Roseibium sp. KMA01]WFE87567.1 RsmB/NOP family class I SAM-dependent RNA methyltransferase [Roseibium sp. KMA01]